MFNEKDISWLKKEISEQIRGFCEQCREPKSGVLLEQEVSRLTDEIISEARARDQIKSLKEHYGSDLNGKKFWRLGVGMECF